MKEFIVMPSADYIHILLLILAIGRLKKNGVVQHKKPRRSTASKEANKVSHSQLFLHKRPRTS